MAKYYYKVSPQVAGELGPKTEFLSRTPFRVSFVEYLFNIWPCDPLVEAYPCFIVREDLRQAIQRNGLMGVTFDECEVGFTDYVDASDRIELPRFYRLNLVGELWVDDFVIDPIQNLIVANTGTIVNSNS